MIEILDINTTNAEVKKALKNSEGSEAVILIQRIRDINEDIIKVRKYAVAINESVEIEGEEE